MCGNYRHIRHKATWILRHRHDRSCGKYIFPMDQDSHHLSSLNPIKMGHQQQIYLYQSYCRDCLKFVNLMLSD